MDSQKLVDIALDELRNEEERIRIEAIKADIIRKREGLLYRLWFNLLHKKPKITWEYR